MFYGVSVLLILILKDYSYTLSILVLFLSVFCRRSLKYFRKMKQVDVMKQITFDSFIKIADEFREVRKVDRRTGHLFKNRTKPLTMRYFNEKHGYIFYVEPKPSSSKCKLHKETFDGVGEMSRLFELHDGKLTNIQF